MSCPLCAAQLAPVGSEWCRCGGCGYEISTEAHQLHRELVDFFERDPDKFFTEVRERRDAIRALEPVWQRSC
ncbi:hypothetical protein OG741_12475 [Streptomyces sp. NBC_01410]|uniref:hypothetical protein n=1 Tax=Streptomyces sp. NBC_01410 TaxID=2903856 RepID=UPI003255DEEB